MSESSTTSSKPASKKTTAAKKMVREGYWQSPVGVIPVEWEVNKIGEIAEIFVGSDLKVERFSTVNNSEYKFPVYSNTVENLGFYGGYYNFKEYNGESVTIIGRGAGLGTAFYRKKAFGAIGRLLVLYPKSEYDPKFITEIINSGGINIHIESTGIPQLTGQQLVGYKIVCPPLPEQRKIATILSSWDEAIEKTQAIVDRLKERNRGLAAELLSGRKRLGVGNWKLLKIRDLFEEVTSLNDGSFTHRIMTISSTQGLVDQEQKFDRVIAGESLKKYTLLRKGDFAYNKGNSKTYPMGCIFQLEEGSALVPFVYICLRPSSKVVAGFYRHWFLAHGLDKQLKRIITSGARGDGLLNVNKKDFFNLNIPYPSQEEQIEITKILDESIKELQHYQQKLTTLKEQKRGLMQVLLTGEKRVKI